MLHISKKVKGFAAEEIYLRQATANKLKNERLARAEYTDQSEFYTVPYGR